MPMTAIFGQRMELFFVLACFVTLTACERVGSQLSDKDPNYPSKDPSPAHVVQIYGSVSDTIDLQMFAIYEAKKKIGCRFSPTLIAGLVEGVSSSIFLKVPLLVKRTSEKFSAEVTIDLFERGYCEWEFKSVSAAVSKDGLYSLPNRILNNPIDISRTAVVDGSIIWQCRFSPLKGLNKEIQMSVCDGLPSSEHKLDQQKTRYEIHFKDIEMMSPNHVGY